MRAITRSVIILTTFSLSACIGQDYHYISIESDQFSATEWGRSELQDAAIHFFSHHDMPVRYQANREQYQVSADLYLGLTYGPPNMTYSATTPDGSELLVAGDSIDDCFGYFVDDMWHEAPLETGLPSLRYVWATRGVQRCYERKEPLYQTRRVMLRISDTNGRVLGEEDVFFSLKKNGRYYVWDGP